MRDAARAAGGAARRPGARRPTRTSSAWSRPRPGWRATSAAAEEGEARAVELRARTAALSDEVDVAVGELTTLKVDGDAGGGAPPERAADARAAARGSRGARRRARRASRRRWRRTRRARPRCAATRCACATRRRCGRPRPRRGRAPTASARARSRSGRRGWRSAKRSCARRAPRSPGWRRRCRGWRCAARRSVLRRTSLEEHVADRYRDVDLGSVVYDYHLRPLFGAEEEKRADRAARPHRAHGRDQPDRDRGVGGAAEALRLPDRRRRPTSSRRSASSRRRSSASTAPRGSASARRSTRSTPSSRRCSRACSAAAAPAWC